MRKRLDGGSLLLVLIASWLTGCEMLDSPPAGVDLSSPKPVAEAYLKAIQRGDALAARSLSVGNSEQKTWVDAMASLIGAMRALDSAIYAKFGRVEFQIHTDLHESISALADEPLMLVAAGNVSEDGEIAKIDPDPKKKTTFTAKFQPSVYLLHKKNGWRVNLASTYAHDVAPEKMPEVSASYELYRRLANCIRANAGDVSAGRFKTVEEAEQSLAERIKVLGQPPK